MYFNGTIVITDPCYLNHGFNRNENLINCLNNYLKEPTLYGDWACTTFKAPNVIFNENTEYSSFMIFEYKKGEFCADSGQVCVCNLDDILLLNPNFLRWAVEHPWCVTIIPHWEGDIEIKYSELTHSNMVLGSAKNTRFNFFTIQTGL